MRKVYLELKVRMVMMIDDGVEVGNVVDEMDYDFNSNDASILDTEILDYGVTDSK